ncbi:conserved hypothetical protein [Talaromyces stipitatus ATCC 10500]|uniref:Tc1-like transposase DDE domain-containing protein n=1 Tax=Talaromyces stipitatus (strain ATCC 10500 / CBS 375.48 / QM 6759 / NRRL 1006) TaxID=441959 RepID=B8MI61_TALSN|nr:uncharacterized protein TSTA_022770 [Talaromyces stipitatus ATCC 10500]EED17223.1 conserved hypothetical protein [Talaromyces stipitatus ATCC 10500]
MELPNRPATENIALEAGQQTRQLIPRPLSNKSNALSGDKISQIGRYLRLGWKCEAIASACNVSRATIFRYQSNLLRYGSLRKPAYRSLGRARKLSQADEDAVFEYLLHESWRQQDEVRSWLYYERGVDVSVPTISRLFKRRKWSRKQLKRISLNRSEPLRRAYLDDIRQFAADDLVFLDESIFNEKTGWRRHAYKLGQDMEHLRSNDAGGLSSLTGDFADWLETKLIPALSQIHRFPMVIVLDNVKIHTREHVSQIIESAGHLIRYLPPYSPDYNPIELTFSVLKSWMKRNWIFLRETCSNYGEFIHLSIQQSRCDRFARKHFKHAGNGVYIEEKELIEFHQFLAQYEADLSVNLFSE